jgi:hypothetical protein
MLTVVDEFIVRPQTFHDKKTKPQIVPKAGWRWEMPREDWGFVVRAHSLLIVLPTRRDGFTIGEPNFKATSNLSHACRLADSACRRGVCTHPGLHTWPQMLITMV